jgi:hypothetical protein
MNGKKYSTQWAAQFRVASDLSRRGYRVSLTLGNAESTDLSVRSPEGRLFDLEVKGLARNNFWLVRERKPREDLFFVFALVPRATAVHASDLEPARFVVASSRQVMAKIEALRKRTESQGKPWPSSGSGLKWGDALEFENRWDVLPA